VLILSTEFFETLSRTPPARSMHAACAQHAENVDRIFQALAWHALAFARLALPWPWHCPIRGISRK
jgi:hypothetical protein